jgi:hypothetical protein
MTLNDEFLLKQLRNKRDVLLVEKEAIIKFRAHSLDQIALFDRELVLIEELKKCYYTLTSLDRILKFDNKRQIERLKRYLLKRNEQAEKFEKLYDEELKLTLLEIQIILDANREEWGRLDRMKKKAAKEALKKSTPITTTSSSDEHQPTATT